MLEARNVPDEREREGHKQSEACEDDQSQVGVVFHLRQVGNDWRPQISHHHKKRYCGPHHVPNNAQLYEEFATIAKAMEC